MMEKTGKIKTIINAFYGETNIDSLELNKRREICNGCEFNSKNIENKNLNLFNKLRKTTLKNQLFCTACGCQIDEKTSQETEECGLSEKGLKPKWNRIKLEIVDKFELDLINKSPDLINIDLSKGGDYFEVRFGKIESNKVEKFSLELKSKDNNYLKVKEVKASCTFCTKVNVEEKNENTYILDISLDFTKISKGSFIKNIALKYDIGNKEKINKIKFVGVKK